MERQIDRKSARQKDRNTETQKEKLLTLFLPFIKIIIDQLEEEIFFSNFVDLKIQ
jgi:hypothetical protein